MGKSGKKWEKVAKSDEKLEKVGGNGKKWGKVVKSGEKLEKVGKSRENVVKSWEKSGESG